MLDDELLNFCGTLRGPSTVSRPRSVREARPHGVRGRTVLFLLLATPRDRRAYDEGTCSVGTLHDQGQASTTDPVWLDAPSMLMIFWTARHQLRKGLRRGVRCWFSVDWAVVVTDNMGAGQVPNSSVYGSDDKDSVAKVGHAFVLFLLCFPSVHVTSRARSCWPSVRCRVGRQLLTRRVVHQPTALTI